MKKASDKFSFAGVAFSSPEEWFGDLSNVTEEQISAQQAKEQEKAETFGGQVFRGYETIIKSSFCKTFIY